MMIPDWERRKKRKPTEQNKQHRMTIPLICRRNERTDAITTCAWLLNACHCQLNFSFVLHNAQCISIHAHCAKSDFYCTRSFCAVAVEFTIAIDVVVSFVVSRIGSSWDGCCSLNSPTTKLSCLVFEMDVSRCRPFFQFTFSLTSKRWHFFRCTFIVAGFRRLYGRIKC